MRTYHKLRKLKAAIILLQILTLFILLSPIVMQAQSIKIPNGWSDGYVYANGIRIHYYHARPAQGKPVMVMVHGVTDNGLCWTTLALKLQDSYDIYMPDTRGHGLSDPFTPSDNGETLIKDVVGFVRAMKFDKPILMGHSMGAATVMRVAAEYPDLPEAVIMLDPFIGKFPAERQGNTARDSAHNKRPAPPPPTKRTAPDHLSVQMFANPETLVAQNNYKFEHLIATGRRQFPKWDSLDIYYWALSKKQYHGPYTVQEWQAMSGTMHTGNSLAEIRVPALILKAGIEGGRVVPPEVRKATEEAARVMQKGKLVYINGAGHNLHHDQLAKTLEVLKKFLATL